MKKLLALLLVATAISSCKKDRIGYVVPVVNPVSTYDNRSVGVSAKDFLTSAKYKAINLEICYVEEHALPQDVIDGAVGFLNKYCNKPGGVWVTQKKIMNQGGKLYVNDLITIEKQFRTKFESTMGENKDTLGLFVLVTEGDYYENGVLGVAYKNTSLALFDGIISDNSGGLVRPSRNTLLSAVLHHELGHILGLVNAGTESQSNHQDGAHGKHCDNRDCLMYYQVQTTDILNVVSGNRVPVLDAACENDLRANGGR